MPRAKNAKADEALALYREGLKLVEIAARLEVPQGTVRRWKCTQGWDGKKSERSKRKKANARKRGGQPGNHNATGAPLGNKRAEKYGFFARYLPEETLEVFTAVAKADPLDLLWHNIQLQYTAIIRAQKIAYVRDWQDKTIERVEEKDGNIIGARWEVQEAWDKQANFMKAQSRAMDSLRGLIKQYTEMLRERGATATEEQKLRLELLRAKLGSGSGEIKRVTIINDTKQRDPDQ
ncbi:hypothetical protein HMPREF1986_02260 [Oribacterium sp. oral taxon 078 str. F0263]|uniref:phage terminase small subunit n=1 Tax=Oribacterium sp. oral taxon 078 TaxID=652706 RepID=UPI0003ADD742|nr:phage terminase small subunit [Oribacterium sp. oral taxon 078]ERL19803.1 hypothetical protein HMPREF1986_02260 [Oribacterium sp. oral taxon 078 str. F0263]